jgi:ABC-type amino acid transport substrate-binding protein
VRKSGIIFFVAVAFLAGFGGAWVFSLRTGSSLNMAPKESTYDRVMRTQTIRCGYLLWNPVLIKDPNTGQLSGIFYDYLEGLGKALHLKIEWTEEMGWGDFPAALRSGRIDAMCAGGWANSTRARVIDFVRPIFYQTMYAYARVDDKRFDNNLGAINDPSVTIITVEGATGSVVAAQDFPKAKNMQLPEMTSFADSFVSLVGGKGDVVITQSSTGIQYDAANPGKIRRIPATAPLRFFGTRIAIDAGQERFRRMLDFASDEMLASGEIEKIIEKYDNNPDSILRVALPYKNLDASH